MEEGCLSVPDVYVKVKRPESIVVSALNIDGKQELIKAEGLLAHAFGQEIDHLNGELYIDKAIPRTIKPIDPVEPEHSL